MFGNWGEEAALRIIKKWIRDKNPMTFQEKLNEKIKERFKEENVAPEFNFRWEYKEIDNGERILRGICSQKKEGEIHTWGTPKNIEWKDGILDIEKTPVNFHLGRQVLLYPWTTVTEKDSTGRTHAYSQGNHKKIALHIRGMITGPSLNWQQATMEKPGGLNPMFVCWLMGYPEDWLNVLYRDWETLSCHK